MDAGKLDLSDIADRNVKWYSHAGNLAVLLNICLPHNSAIALRHLS